MHFYSGVPMHFVSGVDTFIDEAPVDLLTIEFRQPNIVEYFDEFEIARGLVQSKGAKIAIDQIFPDTLGLVNLDGLGATMIKVNWVKDSNDMLKERARLLQRLLDTGSTVVLSRVDNAGALDVGSELGVQCFQGFLIDKKMQTV